MPIPLISKIKPENNGAFPMYDDIDGYGGFQVRASTTDRDSIPTLNRKFAMVVYTQLDGIFWQLNSDLATWTRISESFLGPNNFNFFIDPANVSGLASDANDGLSNTTPLLTTSRLNDILSYKALTADTTITYMSDDIGSTPLNYSLLYLNGFDLFFQGTPQVMHAGGTIDTTNTNPLKRTITINSNAVASTFNLTGANFNFTNSSTNVSATGSLFTQQLVGGSIIQSSTEPGINYVVQSITDDLHLVLVQNFQGNNTTSATAIRISQAGQRQTAHTSDLTDFTPYTFHGGQTGQGAATDPCYIYDPTTGTTAWIVSCTEKSTPSMSRPLLADDFTSGSTAVVSSAMSGQATITGLTGISLAFVNLLLTFSNAVNAANNGTFKITSVIDSTSVTIANASAVAPDLGTLGSGLNWFLDGTFNNGDPYTIYRGSHLVVANLYSPANGSVFSSSYSTFTDFAFGVGSAGSSSSSTSFFRCSFLDTISVPCFMENCFATDDIYLSSNTVFMDGGVLLAFGSQCLELSITRDTYFTGARLFIGTEYVQSLSEGGQFDTGPSGGMQVHDMYAAFGGLQILNSGNLGGFTNIWGSGNTYYGMTISTGSTCYISEFVFTITGLVGDFSFVNSTGIVPQGRPWSDTLLKYGPLANTTWTNFYDPLVFGARAHDAGNNSVILNQSSSPRYLGMVRNPLEFTNLYVDPSNISLQASDYNSGATPTGGTFTGPILTTQQVNNLLHNKRLTVNTTITYTSDDVGSVPLDFSTLDLATFTLTFQGTQQITHSGGTLNSGTIAINPSTNQRQIVHTSDLSSFDGYVSTFMGGTATNPNRIVDNNNSSGSWIVSDTTPASPSCTQPVKLDGSIGSLVSGDNYSIVRGSTLILANTAPPVLGVGASVVFNDFAFGLGSVGPNFNGSYSFLETPTNVYNRCSFLDVVTVPGYFSDCAFMSGVSGPSAMLIAAGLLLPNSSVGQVTGALALGGNCYVAQPTVFNEFIIGADSLSSVYIFEQFGSGSGGIQIQDSVGDGITVLQGAGLLCEVLVWGSGNDGYGIVVSPGATLAIGIPSNVPSVTGTSGDFAFVLPGGGTRVDVARAWDDAVGAYTDAGGPATRITTWANFIVALASGGLEYQAHCLQSGGSLVSTT